MPEQIRRQIGSLHDEKFDLASQVEEKKHEADLLKFDLEQAEVEERARIRIEMKEIVDDVRTAIESLKNALVEIRNLMRELEGQGEYQYSYESTDGKIFTITTEGNIAHYERLVRSSESWLINADLILSERQKEAPNSKIGSFEESVEIRKIRARTWNEADEFFDDDGQLSRLVEVDDGGYTKITTFEYGEDGEVSRREERIKNPDGMIIHRRVFQQLERDGEPFDREVLSEYDDRGRIILRQRIDRSSGAALNDTVASGNRQFLGDQTDPNFEIDFDNLVRPMNVTSTSEDWQIQYEGEDVSSIEISRDQELDYGNGRTGSWLGYGYGAANRFEMPSSIIFRELQRDGTVYESHVIDLKIGDERERFDDGYDENGVFGTHDRSGGTDNLMLAYQKATAETILNQQESNEDQ